MSNFQTYSPATGGLTGTAPQIFVAVTTDSLATVVTAGYIADKVATGETKLRDLWYVTHDDGAGGVAVALFSVTSASSGSFSYFSEAYSAALASIAGLTTAANKMIYTTAANVYATTDLTAYARSLLDDTTNAIARTTLGIHSARGTVNAGGGATRTITDAFIATDDNIVATQYSYGDAHTLLKAVAGTGLITFTFTGDPGNGSEIGYIAIRT